MHVVRRYLQPGAHTTTVLPGAGGESLSCPVFQATEAHSDLAFHPHHNLIRCCQQLDHLLLPASSTRFVFAVIMRSLSTITLAFLAITAFAAPVNLDAFLFGEHAAEKRDLFRRVAGFVDAIYARGVYDGLDADVRGPDKLQHARRR